jgi:hypothetical protein
MSTPVQKESYQELGAQEIHINLDKAESDQRYTGKGDAGLLVYFCSSCYLLKGLECPIGQASAYAHLPLSYRVRSNLSLT